MKTTITTKTAGQITINSTYMGNKLWNIDGANKMQNYNNHIVTVSNNGKRLSFEFWASISNPELKTDEDNISAFGCFLNECYDGSFEDFCYDFGYDPDSRKAEKIYKSCVSSLKKVQRVFGTDIYDLSEELRDKYKI